MSLHAGELRMRGMIVLLGALLMGYLTFNNADPTLLTFTAGVILAPSLVPPKPPAVQPMVDFRQARNEGLDD